MEISRKYAKVKIPIYRVRVSADGESQLLVLGDELVGDISDDELAKPLVCVHSSNQVALHPLKFVC